VAAVETAIDEETVMEVALELTLVVVIEGHAPIERHKLGIAHPARHDQSVRRTVRLEFI
jgi:hypothetical protein